MVTRVFAVLTACVFGVQAINFALLELLPLPHPPSFAIREVADVLKSRRGTAGELRTFRPTAVPAAMLSGLPEKKAARLAEALGLPLSRVRVALNDPPMIGGPPSDRIGTGLPRVSPDDSILLGDFVAMMRRSDGSWVAAKPVRSGMAAWRWRIAAWLLATMVAVAPIAWLLARWVTRPIEAFARAAERLGRDLRAPSLSGSGPAEIVHAAAAFNEMQARLNRVVDDRMLMTGAIAHDLRTPLMRIALRLDRMPDAKRALQDDLTEMDQRIAAAITFVRDGTRPAQRRALDLRAIVETAADDADLGGMVTVVPGSAEIVHGDPVALRSAIDNLLSNALRYAGKAELALDRVADYVELTVSDHGPGVAETDLANIFEPFFRTEASRNRGTGGIGLGLASVRSVAASHGGDVRACNRQPGRGLQVTLRIPV